MFPCALRPLLAAARLDLVKYQIAAAKAAATAMPFPIVVGSAVISDMIKYYTRWHHSLRLKAVAPEAHYCYMAVCCHFNGETSSFFHYPYHIGLCDCYSSSSSNLEILSDGLPKALKSSPIPTIMRFHFGVCSDFAPFPTRIEKGGWKIALFCL